jgi:SAM-dependent methyltransferase
MSMKVSWRRRVWHAIIESRIPLKGPLMRGYLRALERLRSSGEDVEGGAQVNGLAVPPPRLRVLVNGISELDWFLASGKAQTTYIRELLDDVGAPLSGMESVLEFGCGCGRLTRWWSNLPGPEIYACDYNQELVDWCAAHLPFVRVLRNGVRPPLAYADESFGFVYAFSVFTHMSVELAREWLTELRRVTKPGALIWFTVHGRSYRDRLTPEQRRRFDAGQAVVWFPEIEGTNLCAAYWPSAFVSALTSDSFEVLSHLDPQEAPALAQRAQVAPHDAYLLRRA